MTGDGDVVLAFLLRRQPHVAAGLTRDLVTERLESLGKVVSGKVPRKPHIVMTSSLTK